MFGAYICLSLALLFVILWQYLKLKKNDVTKHLERIQVLVSKKDMSVDDIAMLTSEYSCLGQIYAARGDAAKAKACKEFSEAFRKLLTTKLKEDSGK